MSSAPPSNDSPPPEVRASYLVDYKAKTHGTQNPTLMNKLFWKWMIKYGGSAWHAEKKFEGEDNINLAFKPLWCFDRMGQTCTRLPDGRGLVYIGGEHEDFYDPDFCIYNDVVVVRGHKSLSRARLDEIDIYGYPTNAFSPTDFHTATYYRDGEGNEYIYIIGGLGYPGSPHRERTMTHRLDLKDYSIQEMETSGDAPPPQMQLSKDGKAELDDDKILVTLHEENEKYALGLSDMRGYAFLLRRKN